MRREIIFGSNRNFKDKEFKRENKNFKAVFPYWSLMRLNIRMIFVYSIFNTSLDKKNEIARMRINFRTQKKNTSRIFHLQLNWTFFMRNQTGLFIDKLVGKPKYHTSFTKYIDWFQRIHRKNISKIFKD